MARFAWPATQRQHHSHTAQTDDLGPVMAKGRFGKQDFRYVADEDVYICPAGETLPYRYTNEEDGLILRRYHAARNRGSFGECRP
jgi:hypothetical protein